MQIQEGGLRKAQLTRATPWKGLVDSFDYGFDIKWMCGGIEFAVVSQIAPSAPYARLLDSSGAQTDCRFCHQNESRSNEITSGKAFVSDIFKPDPLQPAASVRMTCDQRTSQFFISKTVPLRANFAGEVAPDFSITSKTALEVAPPN